MVQKMRWICMAAMLPAVALAQGQFAQFDFGGGQTTDKPWTQFPLNKKTRVKLDLKNASADAVVSFFENVSGITIVKDPALTGALPLTSARPVPLADAFQILSTTLSLKGYTLSKVDNLLVIKSQKSATQGIGSFPVGGGDGGFPGADTGADRTELKVYAITYANATALAKVLNDVYTPTNTPGAGGFPFGGGGGAPFQIQRGGPGGGNNFRGGGNGFNFQNTRSPAQLPTVKASADDFSNSVIVNAAPREQTEVSALIKSLDKETDLPQHTKVYHLTYAAASDTAGVVQNVLTANVPRGRGGATSAQTSGPTAFFNAIRGQQAGSGQVIPDYRTNSLIVTATDDDLKITDQVVMDLDHKVDFQSTTFVIPLQNARAESIASIIQQSFGTRPGVQSTNTSNPQQYNSSVAAESGTKTTVTNSVNSSSGTRNTTGLGGDNSGDPNSPTYAMVPLGSSWTDPNHPTPNYPGNAEQQAMLQSGERAIPIRLQDPNAQSGELYTSIGVTTTAAAKQFGGGGGGGGQFRPGGGGGGGGQTTNSQNPYTQTQAQNGQLTNVQDPTQGVTVIPDYNSNSLIIVTNPQNADIVKAMIGKLDVIPKQVLIQTTIVEASLDASSKLGVEWSLANSLGKLLHDPTAVGTGSDNFGVQTGNTSGTTSPPGFVYSITGKAFNAYLSALATDSKFQVLSTPRIFTTNNVQAQINVSQEIPYVTSETPDALGNPTYAYSFLNVGIILTIQPRILSNGMVTLDVDQTANELQGYTTVGNTSAPIVNQREAQTTVSVKDGETIILGGIISKQVTSTVNKVPLLGDLPILGNLFRSTSKDTSRTELLVFMTPHVINNPDDAQKQTNQSVKEMTPESQKTLDDAKKPVTPPKP